jgi:hypothetical protein
MRPAGPYLGREMARVLLLSTMAALLFSCGAPAPPVLGGSVSLTPGQTASYRLYTHCGIRSAQINGETFYAVPILDDGLGNPPFGWGNPFDDGQITLHTDGTAEFRDSAGHFATFTSHPPGATPTIDLCS